MWTIEFQSRPCEANSLGWDPRFFVIDSLPVSSDTHQFLKTTSQGEKNTIEDKDGSQS